jgi:hypothetical protein
MYGQIIHLQSDINANAFEIRVKGPKSDVLLTVSYRKSLSCLGAESLAVMTA